MKRVVILVAGLAFVGALAGCTTPSQISARLVGDDIVFAVCENVAFDGLDIGTSSKETRPSELHTSWSLTFDEEIPRRDLRLTYGVLPDGASETAGAEAINPAGTFIHVYLVSGETHIDAAFAQFDGDRISDEYWLSASGRTSQGPCSS